MAAPGFEPATPVTDPHGGAGALDPPVEGSGMGRVAREAKTKRNRQTGDLADG